MPVTVLTATIPERRRMLHELRQCIARQTVKPEKWLVETDHERVGPVGIINRLAEQVETEWLFRCDDDDLYDLDHFEVLRQYLIDGVDIVWSWPRVDPPGWIGEDGLQFDFPIEQIESVNWIASAAAVRTEVWRDLGGYRHVDNEDHDLWKRAYRAGAKFQLVPEITWTYRLGDWPHLSRPED